MKKANALRPPINKTKSLYRINEMLQLYNNQLKANKTLFFKLCFLKKKIKSCAYRKIILSIKKAFHRQKLTTRYDFIDIQIHIVVLNP